MSTRTVTVKMLKDDKGCDNELGKYHGETYRKGETHTMGSDLAKLFIANNTAKVVKEGKKDEGKKDEKATTPDESKENKGDEDK